MTSAAKFAQAAATVYCPERLSVDSGGTAPPPAGG
jgi:hypothetical protein